MPSSAGKNKIQIMIIVLGGGISKEGKLPVWVHSRLEKALALHHETGEGLLMSGKGKDSYNITEAEAMAAYLVGKGVSEDEILLECLSEDTVQNAYYSRTLHVDPMGIRRFTVVTSNFHTERSRHIFEWVFGPEYDITCVGAGDGDIIEADLMERKRIESELLGFHQTVLKEIPDGNLSRMHSFLFKRENLFAKAYRAFTVKFSNSRALY